MGKRKQQLAEPVTVESIKRELRKVELASPTGATGATIFNKRPTPVELLVEQHNIGSVEFQAAGEIEKAFNVIAAGLFIRPQSWERLDRGSNNDGLSAPMIDKINRYSAWANHWSRQSSRLLPMVIASVIDQQSFSSVDQHEGRGRGTAKRALICGLRDYAARAGWAGRDAKRWIETAELEFSGDHPDLSLALSSARVAQ